jgi:hypothetical protein
VRGGGEPHYLAGGDSYEKTCETIAILGTEGSVYSVCCLREPVCPRCVWSRLCSLGNDFRLVDTPNPNRYHPCCAGDFLAMGVGWRNSFQRSWDAVYHYVLGAVQVVCILDDVRTIVPCGVSVPD